MFTSQFIIRKNTAAVQSHCPHFPVFIVYLSDVPEESQHVHLITWFYVIFYFRLRSVITVINSVKNSRKICGLHHVATQSNRNRDRDAIVSCTVRNNDDMASAKGASRANNWVYFSLLRHWIVILPVLWKTILYNQQSPRAIKHYLKGKSLVLQFGSARKFF